MGSLKARALLQMAPRPQSAAEAAKARVPFLAWTKKAGLDVPSLRVAEKLRRRAKKKKQPETGSSESDSDSEVVEEWEPDKQRKKKKKRRKKKAKKKKKKAKKKKRKKKKLTGSSEPTRGKRHWGTARGLLRKLVQPEPESESDGSEAETESDSEDEVADAVEEVVEEIVETLGSIEDLMEWARTETRDWQAEKQSDEQRASMEARLVTEGGMEHMLATLLAREIEQRQRSELTASLREFGERRLPLPRPRARREPP